MAVTTGRVHQVSVSDGGAPKHPVERAHVGALGVEGDRQRDTRHHGGPERAVCLYALELLERLQSEGHPTYPGTLGENLTLAGLPWHRLTPGARLAIGDALVLEIASFTAPCKNVAPSFQDGRFTRVSQKVNPGESRLYARVLAEGEVRPGDTVRLLPESDGEGR